MTTTNKRKPMKKEERLRLAEFTINNCGDSIIFHNCRGEILNVNKTTCNILGYSEKELIGKTIQDINPTSNKKTWTKHWKALRKLKTLTFEDDHYTKNGKVIPIEVTANFIQFGDGEYAVGFARDISVRKRMEEEQKKAFEEIKRLREQLELENEYLYEEMAELQAFGRIIGTSYSLQNILKQIEMVAPTDANTLINGESGTGKELIAHEIHTRSNRAQRPMIRVNCASIPRELYESEFFGHVKGAFTGAIKDRVGRFELANGGTLFLDEVGEIPLDLQSKLLRVLQEGTIEKVGNEKTIKVDVRVIAATNRNLKKEVANGNFREDLYYRLNVFPLEVPALRERKEDIHMLANHFLELAKKNFNRPETKFSKNNLINLERYDWPGNVRELQNVIERAVITSQSGKLVFNLENDLNSKSLSVPNRQKDSISNDKVLTFAEVKEFERDNILAALEQTNWKIFGKDGAAELLDIPPTTLTTRIQRMDLKKS
jgi:PAS domain S-box-containing protein